MIGLVVLARVQGSGPGLASAQGLTLSSGQSTDLSSAQSTVLVGPPASALVSARGSARGSVQARYCPGSERTGRLGKAVFYPTMFSNHSLGSMFYTPVT